MLQDICLIDGTIVPAAEARIPVDDLAFTYGHGAYEHLVVRNRILSFPEEHVARLMVSARTIGLGTPPPGELLAWLRLLCARITEPSFNIKVLLVGGHVYCFASRPKYVPEKAYREGVPVVTYAGERPFPGAKTLSMLVSALAYQHAQKHGAYDALMVDRAGNVPEGSRSNLFYTDGTHVYTPPSADVLPGVTRAFLIEALAQEGITVVERRLHKDELGRYGLFFTSSGAGVLPVKEVDGVPLTLPANIQGIIRTYDAALRAYTATQRPV